MEILSIELLEEGDSVGVIINGAEPLAYTSVKQLSPLGVILYFRDTRLNVDNPDLESVFSPVTAVHASQVETTEKYTTRIEILLAADVPYNVVQDGTSLIVEFPTNLDFAEQSAPESEMETQIAGSTGTASVPATAGGSIQTTGVFQGTGIPVQDENLIWVNRIDFLGESGGRSTLSIETTKKIDYKLEKVSDRLVELRLQNANIAEFRQRPLITTRFESAVNRIMPIQLPAMKDYSLFSIELREPVGYYTEQVGELLLVHFEASSVPPAPADESNLPAWKKALMEGMGPEELLATQAGDKDVEELTEPEEKTEVETIAEDSPDLVLEPDQAMVLKKKLKKYTGEKIALDFFQTDIKNVFRILREVSGKNFAIDKDVSGKVTLTLDKPVPWDQVMDLVLRMNQLGMVLEGDIIRVATLATLKKENDLRKAQIAALQKEREQIKALEPLETRYIPMSYSDAETEVKPHIENILTKDRGKVSVDSKNNQIIITDTVEVIAQALEIARQIDKVTAQVIIEARVVEVEQEYTKELGFNWSLGVGPISINDGGSTFSPNVAMNFPSANATSTFTLNYAKIAGTPFTLDATLNALETSGRGKVLSAPKIATLNNKKAMIKQGQEVGYLERDSSGGATVKFKEIDLLLEVTPHITPDNRISLQILVEKNDVAEYILGVPVIDTNKAETQLLINDGDTIVLGGIIRSKKDRQKRAFPGMHKIPVLGWLFQSNFEEVEDKELLIFMNPKIVQLEQRN